MTDALSDLRSAANATDWKTFGFRKVAWHYGVALLAIVIALALRLALEGVLRGEASYLFFMPAILIASAIGGLGPGLFATVIGLVLGVLLAADIRTLVAADYVDAAVFTLVGIGVSWRGELLRRFRTAAVNSAEDA